MSPSSTEITADHVVVGAGSAGTVLANRLSERADNQVVVLEAGGEDDNELIHTPAGVGMLFRSPVDWDFLTEPQPGLGGRSIYWPRGKVVGGSSSTNIMVWAKGFPADYDAWAAAAGPEWGWEAVRQQYAALEDVARPTASDGRGGPVRVEAQRSPRPYTKAFLQAAAEAGYARGRANGEDPAAFVETMVTQRRGVRWSTADAYLRPALKRPNLTLHTGAQVTRVLFDGTRATGVEAVVDGVPTLVKARREVVLAGGSVSTPQLLMLSGVGPADHLREHGIDVVHDAAEVGRNLADHVIAGFGWEVDGGTLVGAMAPAQRWSYRLRRRGMLTSNAGEAYGFVRSRPDLDLPDVELAFAPAPLFDEGLVPYPNHAVAISAILQTPVSRGTITLRSSDPLDKPVIDPRYLSDPDGADRAAVLGGLRAALDLAQQPSLKAVLGTMVRPVVDGTPGPDELAAAVIEQAAQTGYHPVGTCRMGADAASVVDPQLRVRGVDGLRVADASVMPSLIRGHTNAPAILIGERAAQLLRA